jgi:hypothetical protein
MYNPSQSTFHHHISPWSTNYTSGCNARVHDIVHDSDSSQSSGSPSIDHSSKLYYDKTVSSTNQLAPTLLKRSSLPSTTTWNGKTTTLEKFKALFLGHVEQQAGMGHLLNPITICTWLKLGNENAVLLQLRQLKVHPYIHFISALQFSMDIQWVHGALRQSVLQNGAAIIDKHAIIKDGSAA